MHGYWTGWISLNLQLKNDITENSFLKKKIKKFESGV